MLSSCAQRGGRSIDAALSTDLLATVALSPWIRHDFDVGSIRTIAALMAAGCLLSVTAACTSSSGGSTPTSSGSSSGAVASEPASTSASVATSTAPTSTSTTTSVTHSGPPRPTRPTLPSDVPTTGPNIKRGEKPPIMPLEATQHTADGAKAFAEFFVKTIDWGYAVTSGAYVRHFAAATCSDCTGQANFLDAQRRLGRHFVGSRFTITKSVIANGRGGPGVDTTVRVMFDITAFEEVSTSSKFIRGDGPHNGYSFIVNLHWETAGWVVRQLAATA